MADLRQRTNAGASAPAHDIIDFGGGKMPRAKGPIETPNQGRLLCYVIGLPFIALIVIYPTLLYIYHDPVAATPCKGVCSITDAMVANVPDICKPIDPKKVVFTHIHKTGGTNIKALMEARKYDKEWEMVFMKEWRDAVPHGVVHLPPKELSKTTSKGYETMYRTRFMNGWLHRQRPHGMMFFGHVFFNDFGVPWQDADLEKHPPLPPGHVGYLTMLREPIDRMASQYSFDTFRAKHAIYQEQQRRKQAGRSFGACVKDETCRQDIQLERWCNTQTRYMCGWGAECQQNRPSEAMLETAIHNLETHMTVAGLQEDWITSVRLYEKLLPTYYEGLEEEYARGNKKNCEIWGAEWWRGAVCPYQQNANPRKRDPELDDEAMAILKDKCWADLALYDRAKKRFQLQAQQCL